MPRPCTCERYNPGESYDIKTQCRLCWLYHNSDSYRKLWDRPAGEMAQNPACRPKQPLPAALPGNALRSTLAWFGLAETSKCKCNQRVRQMNDWGPDGCRQNMSVILGWLREEGYARNIPVTDFILRPIVESAIRRAEKAAIQCDTVSQYQSRESPE